MMFVVPKEEARIYGNVKAELLSLLLQYGDRENLNLTLIMDSKLIDESIEWIANKMGKIKMYGVPPRTKKEHKEWLKLLKESEDLK